MTWNACHIYAQNTPEVISLLKSNPIFLPGLYLIESLDDYEWPTEYFLPHGVPKGGLLVAREICETGPTADREILHFHERYSHPVISSSEMDGPHQLKVIRPKHLPMCLW